MSGSASQAWEEFLVYLPPSYEGGEPISYCGLCGNRGEIDTRTSAKTPAGAHCGMVAYCICPNGRHAKKAMKGRKWGGTSVLASLGVEPSERQKGLQER